MQLDIFLHAPEAGYQKVGSTSRTAARKIDESGLKQIIYRRALELLETRNLTSKEIALALGYDKDQVKPRMTELKGMGRVRWYPDPEGGYIMRNGEHVWMR